MRTRRAVPAVPLVREEIFPLASPLVRRCPARVVAPAPELEIVRVVLTREIRDREHDLLSGFMNPSYRARPVDAVEREEKRQMRELRREYDRFRLEEALGFDEDLIRRLRT